MGIGAGVVGPGIPAPAGSDSGSSPTWFDVKSFGAKGDGATDDTTAILATIAAAEAGSYGGVVYFPVGVYIVSAPLYTNRSGVGFQGDKGGTQSVNMSSIGLPVTGSIIKPSNSWANATYHGTQGDGVVLFDGGTPIYNNFFRDLYIDGSSLPTSGTYKTVDGVRLYESVEGFDMRDFGISEPTGNGINVRAGGYPDGTQMYRGVVNLAGLSGITGVFIDSVCLGVHVQSSNTSQSGSGLITDPAGWNITTANARFVSCRSDLTAGTTAGLSGSGWVVEGDVAIEIFSATTFEACGTQRNNGNGFYIVNTSTGASSWRTPFKLTGCSFEGDGVQATEWSAGLPVNGAGGGSAAGIAIYGQNIVTITECSTRVYTADVAGGCPEYAITSGATDPGQTTIRVNGGEFNAVTQAFHNFSGASAGLRNYIDPVALFSLGFENKTPQCGWFDAGASQYGYVDLGSTSVDLSAGANTTILTSPSLIPGLYEVTAVVAVAFTGTGVAGTDYCLSLAAGTASITLPGTSGHSPGASWHAVNTTANDNLASLTITVPVIVTAAGTIIAQVYEGSGGPTTAEALAQDGASSSVQVTYMYWKKLG